MSLSTLELILLIGNLEASYWCYYILSCNVNQQLKVGLVSRSRPQVLEAHCGNSTTIAHDGQYRR